MITIRSVTKIGLLQNYHLQTLKQKYTVNSYCGLHIHIHKIVSGNKLLYCSLLNKTHRPKNVRLKGFAVVNNNDSYEYKNPHTEER